MEKRRGRREIEVTRRRSRGVKKGEHNQASNQFPICSPVWSTQRSSWGPIEKRRGRKEMEMTRREEGELKGEKPV